MFAIMNRFGRFLIFFSDLFKRRESFRIFFNLLMEECEKVGFKSVFIVSIVAFFTGAVTTIQTAYNLSSPWLQDYITALAVRDMILNIIPTLIALIFAGKVGSHIAGELGTMRITEQIDALQVMGINSAHYLVLPKVVAAVLMMPLLIILAFFLSIFGGYAVSVLGDVLPGSQYIYGIRVEFNPFVITLSMIKAVTFGFLVALISSYKGYNTRGGALEVGKSSTKAVISSCITILIADYVITQLFVG